MCILEVARTILPIFNVIKGNRLNEPIEQKMVYTFKTNLVQVYF